MDQSTENSLFTVSRAILFADMGGSTGLYERFGDVAAHRIANECLGLIIKVVLQNQGCIIKTIGDEVMATFQSADAASTAAREIQASTTGDVSDRQVHFEVHVGFHFGQVIEARGDVFGDAVNVAARMVSLAREGEILTTRQTVDALSERECARTRHIDHRVLKGKREAVDVFAVIWQTDELTLMQPMFPQAEEMTSVCIVLQTEHERVELSPACPEVRIGRSPDSEIVVADQCASRHHASIVLRNDKFVLRDTSTNGTICHPRNATPVVLRREEMVLPDAGSISLRSRVSPDDKPLIEFHTEPWLRNKGGFGSAGRMN